MSLLIALSLLVTSELSIQAGKVEEFLAIVYNDLEVSRNYSGNQSFDIFLSQENPEKVLFVEKWESEQHFRRYYQWRLEQGDFELLREYFSALPQMRFYSELDGSGSEDE